MTASLSNGHEAAIEPAVPVHVRAHPGPGDHCDRPTRAVLVRPTSTVPGDGPSSGRREHRGRRMNTIDIDDTLADLVTDNPARASVLERFHLDYCCNGQVSLVDACTRSKIDPHVVAAELADVESFDTKDWRSLRVDQLADHIEQTHHAYLHAELALLSALTAKVADAHGARHPELERIRSCYEELRADLEPHLLKEERVLFPMIRALASAERVPQFHCGSVRNPISVMLVEHDTAGALFSRLRELTDGYRVPSDGCTSYRVLFARLAELEGDTHLHIYKENSVLFPAVLQLERTS
jgi:regulator of cell morphogenesis and NO signaling